MFIKTFLVLIHIILLCGGKIKTFKKQNYFKEYFGITQNN